MDWRQIQVRLKALGYDPGPIDGIYGRLTRRAVKAFQAAYGVKVKWPGTVGPKTLKALFPDDKDGTPEPEVKIPWLAELARKKGLHEVYNYNNLSRWLKSDGATLGDPRKYPWCGDAIETCIAKTLSEEPLPNNPYGARNWMKFGRATKPTVGSVAVFSIVASVCTSN